VKQLQTDMQRMTKVEIDTREVVQEVGRVTTGAAFEKARQQADEARARRQFRALPPDGSTMTLTRPK
jgi:hypothetical protein